MKSKLFALLLLLSVGFPLMAQVRISGTVSDNVGPMIGASVLEKGTTNGTVTGTDGSFSLTVKPGATIVVSSIGYKEQEIAIGNQTRFSIIMEEDTEMIEETVVIGYGVQRKSDVTGAIASVGADVLKNRSVDNVAAAFSGKTSGVQVISSSGDPGAIGSIRIRGISSNSNDASDPLYIVDGLQVSSLSAVDPQNVKSIEILKDAASAAIYGAQAGNGVIVITTKTGEKGKGKTFYNGSYTIEKLGIHPQTLNAREYIEFMEGAGSLAQSTVDEYWDGKVDTDWFDFMFPGGVAQRHTVGVQGANDRASYYSSISFLDNDGMVYGDRDTFKRTNFQLNADYKINDWLKVGTTNTFQIRRSSYNLGSMGGSDLSIMSAVLTLDPLTPPLCGGEGGTVPKYMQVMLDNGFEVLTAPNGQYITTSMFNERTANPLASIYMYRDGRKENINFNGTLYANMTPFKGFTYTSRFGYTLSAAETSRYVAPYFLNALMQSTTYDLSDRVSYGLGYQWDNYINYTVTLAQKHKFDVMAGMSYLENNNVYVYGTTDTLKGYAPNFWYLDFSSDDAIDTISGTRTKSASLSYFSRLGYSYDNRYFLQASFRADAFDTSKLSKTNRWGYFPSVSAGWTVTNEPWMKSVDKNTLSFLKFRASWGINGNISVLSDYQYATTITKGASNYQLTSGTAITNASYPGKLANEGLSWEKSKQFDAGVEARFLNNRLSTTLDWYLKDTDGLIVPVTPSFITGQKEVYMNSGSVRNKGFEFELSWKDTIGDFSYGISGNISHNTNLVTFLDPTLTFIDGTKVSNIHFATRFMEGYPIWGFFGLDYEGVNEQTGEPIYTDVNNDGKLNNDDMMYLGSAQPDFTYGITLNAEWKGFDLTVFGSGSQGNKIWFAGMRQDFVGRNFPVYFYDNAWKNPGDKSLYPAYKYINTTALLQSDAVLFDGSYFRINQIQLGYTLPKGLLKAVKLEEVRIYTSLDDYFTFTKYIGFDPVVAGDDAGKGRGIDRGTYPTSKRIMFGLNVSF
jgi:TonB-linked SusC/RagA family outer membrane protein